MPPTARHRFGHEEIARERKIDPGPAFPPEKYRERLLFSDRSDDAAPARHRAEEFPLEGVAASQLDIRPHLEACMLAAPLARGARVEILGEMVTGPVGAHRSVKKGFVSI